MAGKIRSVLRLYRLYARMDLNWMLQDIPSAIVVLISEGVWSVCMVLGVVLLSVRFGGAGGLTSDEVLFLQGFFLLANGLIRMFFGGFNVFFISRRIGRGQMDHMLIQPRSLPVQIITEGFLPFSGNTGLINGLIVTGIAVNRLKISITPAWVCMLLFYIIVYAALLIGQSYLYGSLAFWKPVAAEEISSMIVSLNEQLGKFPLYGIPTAVMVFLTTLLPAGLLGYVPTLQLVRAMNRPEILALPACVAAAFVAAASAAFRAGLAQYMKNGSNRYKDMGHRN